MSAFSRLFQSRPRTGRRPAAPVARRARFDVERLDDRLLPSTTAFLDGNTLVVSSDGRPGDVNVTYSGNHATVTAANHPDGGLEVTLTLPARSTDAGKST